MNVKIVKCPSGFWAVMVNGVMFYGACKNREQAEIVVKTLKRKEKR